MYGKTFMGIERSTFVIDADGTVARALRKVKPDEHAGLEILDSLASCTPSLRERDGRLLAPLRVAVAELLLQEPLELAARRQLLA